MISNGGLNNACV